MKREFAELNIETSRSVLRTYQSRKQAVGVESDQRRLAQLHTAWSTSEFVTFETF